MKRSAIAMILAALLPIAGGIRAAQYTNDTNWAGAGLTLDDGDVIAGVHTNIGHFAVASGATATVAAYADGTFGWTRIYAASATIEGALSADGAGYPAGDGPGAGAAMSGAGYGGRGGVGGESGLPGMEYGLAEQPSELGSGGGNHGGLGGRGGGVIHLLVDGALTVSGSVTAHGGSAAGHAGGGSGGGIRLRAAVISGAGLVGADGGLAAGGGAHGAGGAGGRIAFDTPTNQFAGIIRAAGRPGLRDRARNGTFTFVSGPEVDLWITNDIALPPGTNWVFRDLRVGNGAVFEIHSVTTTPSRAHFRGNVWVEVGSALSADGWGHWRNQGPGAGNAMSGAGYGGRGGVGDQNSIPGMEYGLAGQPEELGSGGGSWGTGGVGGGALILDITGSLTVDGVVSANGGNGNGHSGGGSGGAIRLTAARIAGSGTISADGGLAVTGTLGGGGGGGRIAFDTPINQFAGIIRAAGRPGYRDRARNGTFTFASGPEVDLWITNDIALPPGTNWVFRDLRVGNGAVFEIHSVTTTPSRARFLGNVQVEAGSTLSADGWGYWRSQGPGAGGNFCGAGYGGRGGVGDQFGITGMEYGLAEQPAELGSGGGNWAGTGGVGGGALILDMTGSLTVDGIVSANGGNGNGHSGGGSGGAIRLTAARIAGSGTISADGGLAVAGALGGGGGGGRIAFDTPTNQFNGVIRAAGRPGYRDRARNGTFPFVSGPEIDLWITNDIALPPGTNWVFRDLRIGNGAVFEIHSVTTTPSRVRFHGNVQVEAGSALSADGWGHWRSQGPGAGTSMCGGGYGGVGGRGDVGIPGGAYGEAEQPEELGSGGGPYGSGTGGVGGGALILDIMGSLIVDGIVSANGGYCNQHSGGGSGGSIRLTAAAISGGGRVSADGGRSVPGNYGAGGAGGRIFLLTGDIGDAVRRAQEIQKKTLPPASFSGAFSVAGMPGYIENGEDGTMVFRYLPMPRGMFIMVK